MWRHLLIEMIDTIRYSSEGHIYFNIIQQKWLPHNVGPNLHQMSVFTAELVYKHQHTEHTIKSYNKHMPTPKFRYSWGYTVRVIVEQTRFNIVTKTPLFCWSHGMGVLNKFGQMQELTNDNYFYITLYSKFHIDVRTSNLLLNKKAPSITCPTRYLQRLPRYDLKMADS